MSRDTVESIRADLASGKARLRLIKSEETWYAESARMGWHNSQVMSWSLGVDAVREGGGDDGTYGEWSLDWYSFQREAPCLKIGAYSDSFVALEASGLLPELLRVGPNASPEMVLALLDRLGFVDCTERARAEVSG